MKIVDILKEERAENRDVTVARMYLEGDWYRAYELSAFMVRNYPNALNDNNRLKPSHKQSKEAGESVISVGMKLASIEKFMPNCERTMGDGYIDIKIPNLTFNGDFNEEFQRWKDSVPVAKYQQAGKVYSKPFSMTDIFKEVMTYRMENTTPDDDREFLYAIKEKCYAIFG